MSNPYIKSTGYDFDRAELLEGFIPAENRDWYPFTWPDLKSMSKSERAAKRLEIRKLADEDFFFFSEVIMRGEFGFRLHPGLHDEVCYIAQHREDALILLPRNHLKTTLCSIYYTVWRLALNQNMRIAILTDVLPLAKKILSAIKSHVENNPRLRWVYPELRPAMTSDTTMKDNWNKEEITVQRTQFGMMVPSVIIGSTEQPLTGVHVDEMIFDDIVTSKNTKKENSLEKINDWYEDIINLLDMGGKKGFRGTRYNYGDQYARLMKNGVVKTYRRKHKENGKYIWPEDENIALCLKKKKELSPYNFSCQMDNEPIQKGEAAFEYEWVENRRYGVDDIRKKMNLEGEKDDRVVMKKWYSTLNIYQGSDPARSTKKTSDYTTVMIAGMDELGHIYGLQFIRKRLKTHQIIQKNIDMYYDWNPKTASVETYGGDIHIFNGITKKIKDSGKPTHRWKQYAQTSHMNNEDKIQKLENPMFEGKIHLPESNMSFSSDGTVTYGIPDENDWDVVCKEFLQFPYAEHDDCSTLLALMWDQCKSKKKIREVKPQTGWRFRKSADVGSKLWQVA